MNQRQLRTRTQPSVPPPINDADLDPDTTVEQLTALAEFRGRTATDLADELGTVKAERDYWRSQVAVVLSKSCPVQSNECAIRQRCTNKCGQLVDLVTLRTK